MCSNVPNFSFVLTVQNVLKACYLYSLTLSSKTVYKKQFVKLVTFSFDCLKNSRVLLILGG